MTEYAGGQPGVGSAVDVGAVEHFGELVRPGKYGHRLTREMYAMVNKKSSTRISEHLLTEELRVLLAPNYEDAELTIHTDEFCRRQREAALGNFDLNMAFFAKIPQTDFEEALTEMLAKNKRLRPVTDLRSLDGEEGVYVLVLDKYRQAYIGQSQDMRRRIKAHWSGTKQFDRLLWGGVEESVMSIDAFRALDTTRIFASRTINADALEARLVRTFPPDYLLNRIDGGAVTGLRALFIGAESYTPPLQYDPPWQPTCSDSAHRCLTGIRAQPSTSPSPSSHTLSDLSRPTDTIAVM